MLTTEFRGPALPDGWTEDKPATVPGAGSMAFVNGRCELSLPAGTNFDGYFASSTNDNSYGVKHDLPAGSFKIAFRIDSDVSHRKGVGFNIVVEGDGTNEHVRASIQHGNTEVWAPSAFFYGRNSTGGGTTFESKANWNTHMSGTTAWLALEFNDATKTWSFWVSSGGKNWYKVCLDGVKDFVPKRIKAGMFAATPSVGGTVRLARCVDMLAHGSDDLRAALPTRVRVPKYSLSGASPTLDTAVWQNDSYASATLAHNGAGAWRFTARPGSDSGNNSARIRGKVDPLTSWGILLKVHSAAQGGSSASCYGTIGAATVAQWIDQYVPGLDKLAGDSWGLAEEINNGTIRRPILKTNRNDANITPPTPYSTGLLETDYNHLEDLVDVNMRAVGPVMFRLEYTAWDTIYGRYRVKTWLDGSPEPADYNLFDGEIRPFEAPCYPFFSISQNFLPNANPAGQPDTPFDVYQFDWYALEEEPDPPDPDPDPGPTPGANLDTEEEFEYRSHIVQVLKGYAPLTQLVPPDRIRSASNIDKQMKRPSISVRLHTGFPVGRRVGERLYAQVWVYDAPGDYLRIDRIQRKVREALELAVPQGPFLEARWIETGVDLRDDVMEAIVKYSRFQITGTDRRNL